MFAGLYLLERSRPPLCFWLERNIYLKRKGPVTLGHAGLPTVPAEPVGRQDKFYTDQHVIGVIWLASSW